MSLHNIKDNAPNQELVEQIEMALEQAKAGELRSIFWVKQWSDDCVCHGWALDQRNSRRRMLAEMVMAQHDFVVNIELKERDSVLAAALDG